MEYVKSQKYDTPEIKKKMMGPNPIKLTAELLMNHHIDEKSVVCDLGSGQGLTSVFLAKEYGLTVYATDLWSDPQENQKFFDEMKVDRKQLIPVKADAVNLPFEKEFFDAVISIDSYNYFGRDPLYLDQYLLPYVKKGGYVYISIPGMKKDCHDHLPPELLLSWTPEQLAYMRDIHYWTSLMKQCHSADIISIKEMESHDEVWQDWLEQDNEYAVGDRKSMEAGAGKYLNFIAIVLKKR